MGFVIECPECGNSFQLTKELIINDYPSTQYFNELKMNSYNGHIKLSCPNCGYYETDKEG